MPDRIRNAIVDLTAKIGWIEGNDYHKFPGWQNVTDAMREAVALLKEREPVKLDKEYSRSRDTWWYVCPKCRVARNLNDKYCSECGRPILRKGGEVGCRWRNTDTRLIGNESQRRRKKALVGCARCAESNAGNRGNRLTRTKGR